MKETIREAVWRNQVGETFFASRCKKCHAKVNAFNFDTDSKKVLCGRCTGKVSPLKKKREAVWKYRAGNKFCVKCPIPFCTNMLTPFQFEVCHIVAKAKGGEDDLENMHIGCTSCNRRMGTTSYFEYKQKVLDMHGAEDPEKYEVEYIIEEDFDKDLFLVKWKKWPDAANTKISSTAFENQNPYDGYEWLT
jgi:5-methylcytosine-specific restriction endonuclease McrA